MNGKTVRIQLEEQDRGFAMDSGRKIQGTVRIKEHGTAVEINLKVSNLRQDKNRYRFFFIGRKNGGSVYKLMSMIEPDLNGDASVNLTADPADIDGEGSGLSCFYIFMLAAAGEPMRPVLRGDLLRSRTVADHREKKQHQNRADQGGPEKKYNEYYSEYIRKKTERLIDRSDSFADISPFDDVWLTDNWKRVENALALPLASAGAETQLMKYGHFIFAYDGNMFYLGIPGTHDEEEWPDRGRSGFVMWQPIRGSVKYGYWCTVIDWKTGIIVEIS